MTLEEKWINELQSEYRNRLRAMEGLKEGSNDHEMYKWEAGDILQLMILIHSNYGIGYPFGSKLRSLINSTSSKYVDEKGYEILKIWEGSTI